MKTAIPLQNGKIAADFHTAPEFTLVSGSGWELELETKTFAPGISPLDLVQKLSTDGVERVLAGGIDAAAISACEQAGMLVFHGAGGTLSDALNLIRLGILDNMAGKGGCGGSCSSGGCGGCGSDESQSSSSCGSGSCGCN